MNFLNNLPMAKKMLVGFGSILTMMLLVVVFLIYQLNVQEKLQSQVIDLRAPTNLSGHDLVNGINHSLAALRGYMILDQEKFKTQRAEAWLAIDKHLSFMREMSKSWTVPANVEKLKRLETELAEFKRAQQRVEDIANTIDEQPALKILLQDAAPVAEEVVSTITQLIDLEKTMPATVERKQLLSTMADSRASFAMGLASIRAYLLSGNNEWVTDFNQRWTLNERLSAALAQEKHMMSPAQKSTVKQYLDARSTFSALPKKMFDIRASDRWNEAHYRLANEAAPRAAAALKILKGMTENQDYLMQVDAAALKARSEAMRNMSIIAVVAALAVGMLFAYFITRAIIGPLKTASDATRRIANGDLSEDIISSSQDEIGQLLVSMAYMQDQLKEVIEVDIQTLVNRANRGDLSYRIDLSNKKGFCNDLSSGVNDLVAVNEAAIKDVLNALTNLSNGNLDTQVGSSYEGIFKELAGSIRQTQRQLSQIIEEDIQSVVSASVNGDLSERIAMEDKKGFFANLSNGINALVEVLDQVTSDVNQVLSEVAGGNLTQKIENDYQGRFNELKSSINSTIKKLSDIVINIQSASSAVEGDSNVIAASNSALSDRTERQAANLEETAASMDQISSTVKNTSDQAFRANELASASREEAISGGAVVDEAVEAMAEINASSAKIVEIIGVIDDIAFQTNLLALNASVEAARAGVQGRGFAVVASEVGNLAGRSSIAAKQIKELIEDSTKKVEAGSTLVSQSGDKLSSIVTSVDGVSKAVSEIATAVEEQAVGVNETHKALENLQQLTQQNTAMVEEAAATSEALSQEANNLNDQVAYFDVGLRDSDTTVSSVPIKRIA